MLRAPPAAFFARQSRFIGRDPDDAAFYET
jgi:hypothetical protein